LVSPTDNGRLFMFDPVNKIEKSYALIRSEGNSQQRTLYFKTNKKNINPGQFYMLNYKNCQKPISVSHNENGVTGFTIQDRGECTGRMINAGEGEFFGLTGPLGTGFKTGDFKNILIIGGGIGTAPVYFLVDRLIKDNKKFDALFGARTKLNLEYTLSKQSKIKYYTDDGSFGQEGFVIDDLAELLKNSSYDCCCICGPEKMMKFTLDKIGNKIGNIQISMERYMKCGLGICGSCVLDDIGLRVCEEGPVFSYGDLIKSGEFTKYHRNDKGLIEYFK
jgi:dihydroorotate dehydrogenase electron transfer subunit